MFYCVYGQMSEIKNYYYYINDNSSNSRISKMHNVQETQKTVITQTDN